MPIFSKRSLENLEGCAPNLQIVAKDAIKRFDFAVVCGNRGKIDQEQAFKDGRSKVHYPKSAHNFIPSRAMDLVPYWDKIPHIRWGEKSDYAALSQEEKTSYPTFEDYRDVCVLAFNKMAREIFSSAQKFNVKIEWGGNWKMQDLPHFQEKRT